MDTLSNNVWQRRGSCLEHPIVSKMLRQYSASDSGPRALAGKANGLADSGLLTIWKINTQGKDGQASHHIVRIGMTEEGDSAPWLECLEYDLLGMDAPTSKIPDEWQRVAISRKQRLQELLHRELSHSGTINEEMSYSAVPLVMLGIEM